MSGRVPPSKLAKQNPAAAIGLYLYEAGKNGDKNTGWKATDYDAEGDSFYIIFEHPQFDPWDISLNQLEVVVDLSRGKTYLREK